jgi:thermostable 8-oxoguanine DNA glycosylase
MKNHKTIFDPEFQLNENDYKFNYQKNLTKKLDNQTGEFDQNIINEIVLWKVNRYAEIDLETLKLINNIDPLSNQLDKQQTTEILRRLLDKTNKGIQLPMASTILNFKNRHIYQIIDQRVYRVLYKEKTLELPVYQSEANINIQIELYLKYLEDLHTACDQLQIPFKEADRILYEVDKRINKEISLENYGSKAKE